MDDSGESRNPPAPTSGASRPKTSRLPDVPATL